MGQRGCTGDHDYVVHDLGAGVARLECSRCYSVVIDLDAARDGYTVTVPGLFGPARPTIFSALAEERRRQETEAEPPRRGTGGRYAFGGGSPARRR